VFHLWLKKSFVSFAAISSLAAALGATAGLPSSAGYTAGQASSGTLGVISHLNVHLALKLL